MPLRVLHIVSPSFGYTFNGTTRRILRLLQEWCEPEIDFSVWGSNYLKRSKKTGDFWSKTIRHTRRVRFVWSLRLLWMLFLKRRDYDLVHMHQLWWGGLLVPVLIRLLGKKAIYHMTLLGSDNPSALAAQSLGWLKLALFKQYHALIGLTPALVQDCHRNNLGSKLLILPNYLVFEPRTSVDAIYYGRTRQSLGIPEQAQVLLFVGSIIGRKGIDLLVDLFIELTHQHTELWLLLVGAYSRAENPRLDESFVAEQRAKLVRAGVSERVVWAGLVRDETELANLYAASDLFIFPTRAEGQGNVILEAMGCGIPVVCTHLRGITDAMVINDQTGYLIDLDDLRGFIAATAQLLDKPEMRQTMGAAGRKRATGDFAFGQYCRKLADFYQLVATDD